MYMYVKRQMRMCMCIHAHAYIHVEAQVVVEHVFTWTLNSFVADEAKIHVEKINGFPCFWVSGAPSGPSWGILGGSWEGSWEGLEGILRSLGPSWASLETSGGHLGPARSAKGTLLGPLEAPGSRIVENPGTFYHF